MQTVRIEKKQADRSIEIMKSNDFAGQTIREIPSLIEKLASVTTDMQAIDMTDEEYDLFILSILKT